MLVVLDFETYYDAKYSLSKMTTEEYIRHPSFEPLILGARHSSGVVKTYDLSDMPRAQVRELLCDVYRLHESALLCQNTAFDGAILNWHYGIKPRRYLDTMLLARLLLRHRIGSTSLAAIAKALGCGQKGTEVVSALGKHREDFTPAEWSAYRQYCANDVQLTYDVFAKLAPLAPRRELEVMHTTLRWYIEPTLELDVSALTEAIEGEQDSRAALLRQCPLDQKELASNKKFAEWLTSINVAVPTKVSPRTGKEIPAIAKSDKEFRAMADSHPDPVVRAACAARLGVKSRIKETRLERFRGIAERNASKLPVPLLYSGAHTHRYAGIEQINLQNLPHGTLRDVIVAPRGHVVLSADQGQIEARLNAVLAGQHDLVEGFRNDEDVYIMMAEKIYGRAVGKDDPERKVGKATVLGCIAEDTPVLCKSGWKPIQYITIQDEVWDGQQWVRHGGLLRKGYKETLSLCESWLTPDHPVLCGGEWKASEAVARDESTLCLALETAKANLPSQAMLSANGAGSRRSSSSAIADFLNTLSMSITTGLGARSGVMCAPSKPASANSIGRMLARFLTTTTGLGYSTGFPLPSPGATTLKMQGTHTTAAGASPFAGSGGKTGRRFYGTYNDLKAGTTPHWKWIDEITKRGTSPATYDSALAAKTWATDARSKNCRRLLPTYDISYAGPRNSFTIMTSAGPLIVHNCGYGMGADRAYDFFTGQWGIADMTRQFAGDIIDIYRREMHAIRKNWHRVDELLQVVAHGGEERYGPVVFRKGEVELPSGVKVYYPDMSYDEAQGGYTYSRYDRRTRQWLRVKIYGAMMVENLCQSLARELLTDQLVTLEKRYKSVHQIHDEIVFVVPEDEADLAVKVMRAVMQTPPAWLPELPLKVEPKYGRSLGDCK